MRKFLKPLTEFGPLAAFFIAYKLYGLIPATATLVAATVLAVAVMYIVERKVPMISLITALIISLLGTITIYSHNTMFIKIKPTIVNSAFAAILLVGVLMGKPLIKYLIGSVLDLPEPIWLKLSFRWGIFFLFLAVVNEIVWRNFSEASWVNFKVFGMLPLNMLFLASQLPLIMKHSKAPEDGDGEDA